MGKVLHASASGYFPFCIVSGSKLNPSEYPFQTNLQNAMALFWKVKTWRVQGYITDTIVQPFYVKNDTSIFTPSDETQLVCAVGITINTFEEVSGEFEATSIGFFNYDVSGNGVGFDGNSYVPKFVFQGTYTTATFSRQGRSDTNPGSDSGNLTISGFATIPLYRQPDLSPEDPQAPFYENGSWTITPEEYWSYGGTYDTSTGLPL